MASYKSIRTMLEEHKQQHLLDYYPVLSPKEQSKLLKEIVNVNIPAFTSKIILLVVHYLLYICLLVNCSIRYIYIKFSIFVI